MEKNKNSLKLFTAFCALAISLTCSLGVAAVPSVSANSAQTYWRGVTRAGAIVTGGECPIIVENENLTFDLQEFPKNYYSELSDFLAYSGKVTAEYTFSNPSDMNVEATLLFPFGELSYDSFYDEDGNLIYSPDREKYEILVDGEPIEKTVRHTISYSGGSFDLEADLSRVSSGFINDDFFKLDLPVTVYKYSVSGVDFETYPAATVGVDVYRGGSDYKLLFNKASGMSMIGETMRLSTFVNKRESSFQIIKFGNGEFKPQFKFYKNGDVADKNELKSGGAVSLVYEQTFNFKQFALQNRVENCEVSEVDWVNALICELTLPSKYKEGYPVVEAPAYLNNYRANFMRWYEYKINVAAGKTITNTVTAPIYPFIDATYKPTVFGYTYLLSPASKWKSFGKLNVVVNTPYYMSECSLSGFEKTEGGYSFSASGLPSVELTFLLSTSENPVRPKKHTSKPFAVVYVVVSLIAVAVIAVFIVVPIMILRQKKHRPRG